MKTTDIFEQGKLDINLSDTLDNDDDNILVVGITGQMDNDFNEEVAFEMLDSLLNDVQEEFIDDGDFEDIIIFGKSVNEGINKIAFKIAEESGYKTIGFEDQDDDDDSNNYPNDEIVINDTDGTIDEFFIDAVDVLIRVGASEKTQELVEMAESDDLPIFESDL